MEKEDQLRVGEETDMAMWSRKISSHIGDPTGLEKPG